MILVLIAVALHHVLPLLHAQRRRRRCRGHCRLLWRPHNIQHVLKRRGSAAQPAPARLGASAEGVHHRLHADELALGQSTLPLLLGLEDLEVGARVGRQTLVQSRLVRVVLLGDGLDTVHSRLGLASATEQAAAQEAVNPPTTGSKTRQNGLADEEGNDDGDADHDREHVVPNRPFHDPDRVVVLRRLLLPQIKLAGHIIVVRLHTDAD
mmetsp:Transcript_2693/g.8055  ORF Transcript_2693/g.8055 Transcript_2693/m.8055 type:complete len:209 (-) Transcript_2693:1342-1968(-)